jgi:acyl-CoA thioester hydrolase
MDHMGHMNVASYTARFDEATWHFLAHLGLTPSFLKQNGRGAVAADQKTQYTREVNAGCLLHVMSHLRELGTKSIHFTHRMYDSENGELVATTDLVGVYFDMEARTPAVLPDLVRERARGLENPAD